MTLKGRWTLLSTATSLARSSHSVSVTKSGLLTVYGGELKPRTPIDTGFGKDDPPRGSLHVFDLNKDNLSQHWTTLSPASPSSDDAAHGSSVPEPRVGATLVCHEDALYMWGGRGGQQMTPFDQHQIGIWKATVDQDGQGAHGIRWERIAPLNEDRAPSPRSYHTSVVHGVSLFLGRGRGRMPVDADHCIHKLQEKLYVHAGCPDTGRLSTLHAFDVQKRIWETLASAPEPGRGGTCLVPAAIRGSGDLLLRYGGTSGSGNPVP